MSGDGNNSRQSIIVDLLEELFEFCQSDSLSEKGLREIIGLHGCNDNDPNIRFFRAACRNEQITEGIIRCLIEYFPNAVRHSGKRGQLPLHNICYNKNVTLGMVQLLINAFPESLRHEDNDCLMPLHVLCIKKNLNEEVKLEILKLLLERCPESVKHTAEYDSLPIHFAAAFQSPQFCSRLIEAYSGSERITNNNGQLPFHVACAWNTVATTAKYLYQLYPESIHVATNVGRYPIHLAIVGLKYRTDSPEAAIEMVLFLLDCEPNVVSQKFQLNLPLYWACKEATNENTRKLNAYLKIVQILYDKYPEAIEDNDVASDVGEFCAELQAFINARLTYARQARDHNIMTTRCENGQLPLHRALCDNITLGSIKLLVKGNPSAISCNDNIGMMPLHVACQHHESASVVEYLINLDPTSLRAIDFEHNTSLHYACRGANHAIIALLTEKYGAVSVSKRNAHGQLPIDLLFASREVSDREGVEYTESIYRLLKAYPATVMNCTTETDEAKHSDSKMSGKKRKIDLV